MKKIIYALTILASCILFASCEKTPVGMTATVDMAGDWYVQADLCDASGNVLEADCYGLGEWHTMTYNTAKNIPTEMYVTDLANFWDYTVKVKVDLNAKTFATEGSVPNEAYDCNVTITNGKISLGTATTPSGMPADAIEYVISFDDDDEGIYYKIRGYRYTGFALDD